ILLVQSTAEQKCCYWLRRQRLNPYWPRYKAMMWLFLRTVAFSAASALNQDKTQFARLIDDRLAQFLITQMIKLASASAGSAAAPARCRKVRRGSFTGDAPRT